ncbi:hypothetical protein IP68_10445 [Blastomonas sp. AAP25]|uniref:phage major capsid protein n=1 Tax=Blastomonas sp. AAP25 TaxID=1523416 RepID=UPI0006B9EDF3|nr:phage major capsid protein [Blastomonas sp. AAP25]KPF75033.1 hypothetical protein IP68_10445 [Blastomonas sp. AAP25]
MNMLTKDFTDAVEQRLEKSDMTAQEAIARLNELEQKMATMGRGGGGWADEQRGSWGHNFIDTKAADLALIASERGRISMQMKTTITSAADSGGSLIVPARDMAVGMPQRRLTIRDLLNVVRVTSGSVEYPKMTARPTAAAPVAEGALKPESAMVMELATAPIRTIAHFIPASRQVLDDAPQLQGIIDVEMLYGLAIKEEQQLLFGDGTGQNLEGMVPQATEFDPVLLFAEPTFIDVIAAAIHQAALSEVSPTGIVVHPTDWWKMRTTKDADGRYILGDPAANVPPNLFGIPVVPTQAMTVDNFLVGGFGAQTLYDRWEARVEISSEHADFFTRNLIAVLCEERIGFAAKLPQALVTGDFTTGLTAATEA